MRMPEGPQPIRFARRQQFAAVSAAPNKIVPVGERHRDDFLSLGKKTCLRNSLCASSRLILVYFTTFKLCTPAKTENPDPAACGSHHIRSEEHTSELQS